MKEIWKLINGHLNYEVSNGGRIKNVVTGFILKNSLNSGYYRVTLDGKQIRVHRLIALAFIPNPENKPFINHKNGVKIDNNISNLEWVTHKENIQHSFRIGLVNRIGTKNNRSLIDNSGVVAIRDAYSFFGKGSQIVIAKYFNISKESVSAICTKRNWSHIV